MDPPRDPPPPGRVCDLRGAAPDLATIERLARLQLLERRRGRRLRARGASAEVRALVALVGLEEVLRLD